MSNDRQRTWTIQDGRDASRLLQELAKRSKKASGSLGEPEQIHENPGAECPSDALGEDGPGERLGDVALHPGPVTVALGGLDCDGIGGPSREGTARASAARGEEVARCRLVIASNDNGACRLMTGEFLVRRQATNAGTYPDTFSERCIEGRRYERWEW